VGLGWGGGGGEGGVVSSQGVPRRDCKGGLGLTLHVPNLWDYVRNF
jgi:hypothetical protein